MTLLAKPIYKWSGMEDAGAPPNSVQENPMTLLTKTEQLVLQLVSGAGPLGARTKDLESNISCHRSTLNAALHTLHNRGIILKTPERRNPLWRLDPRVAAQQLRRAHRNQQILLQIGEILENAGLCIIDKGAF